MGYTSNSEFSLVKRVQITNELPAISLNASLHTGLQTPFWRFLLGSSVSQEGIPLLASAPPLKTVNGVVAPTYGPPLVAPGQNVPTFHSLTVDGVIQPEYDLFLHEAYRYLDTLYPDHPDYAQLLTDVEINDAFKAAAAVLGYSPDYKFAKKWTSSLTVSALLDPAEELKWKIRDLRSIAFRRKFYGSFFGYKLLFAGLYQQGSVYSTGAYTFANSQNPLKDKLFRVIDFYNASDAHFTKSNKTTFPGIVEPGLSDEVSQLPILFEYDAVARTELFPKGTIIISTAEATTSIRNDAFAALQTYDSSTNKFVDDTVSGVRKIALDAYLFPTTRAFDVLDSVTDTTPGFAQLVPSRRVTGGFALTPSAAVKFYPQTLQPSDNVFLTLSNELFVSQGVIADSYVPAGSPTVTKAYAIITHKIPGRLGFSFDNQSSISAITEDTASHGVLIEYPTYVDTSGQLTEVAHSVFIQGALRADRFASTAGDFVLGAIPAINPITQADNWEALGGGDITTSRMTPFQKGISLRFFSLTPTGWVEMVQLKTARLTTFSLGYIQTQTIADLAGGASTSTPFTPTTFLPWVTRAAVQFETEEIKVTSLPFSGYLSGNTILLTDELNKAKSFYLRPGQAIYSSVTSPGAVIESINNDTITLYGESLTNINEGFYSFSVQITGELASDVDLFKFKGEFLSQYPTLLNSSFEFLWPGDYWKTPSQDYLDGFKDINQYDPAATIHPELTPTYLGRPYANVRLQRHLFLEVGAQRLLYHTNTLGLTSGGTPLSLMDLPWLDYVYMEAQKAKKASEVVSVGAQLNLSTDESGYSSIVPGQLFSDSQIQAKFITFPAVLAQDPIPATVQIGSGGFGSNKQQLFVSLSDLTRPPMYGDITYDTNQAIADALRARGIYASADNLLPVKSSSLSSSVTFALEKPLFESLLGEYEVSRIVDPASSTNAFSAITPTFKEQVFTGMSFDLPQEVKLSNPLIFQDFQYKALPFRFHLLGSWNLVIGTGNVLVFPPSTVAVNDYYVIGNDITFGGQDYTAGDWLVWTGTAWRTRRWLPVGIIDSSTTDLTLINLDAIVNSGSVIESIANRLLAGEVFYAIAVEDIPGSINTLPAINALDWAILSQEDGEVQGTWKAASGHQYSLLSLPVNYADVNIGPAFQALVAAKNAAIAAVSAIIDLPHRLITKGSSTFLLPIVLPAIGHDVKGTVVDLSSAPITQHPDGNFYLETTPAAQLDFKEPKYFKNLLPLAGVVTQINDSSTVIEPAPGIAFDVSQISLFDRVYSAQQVLFRNAYDPSAETLYTDHYTNLLGQMVVAHPNDPTTTKLIPISDNPARVDQFRTALLTLLAANPSASIVGDTLKTAAYGFDRKFDSAYERQYFKNLLLVAATVDISDTSVLSPMSSAVEDQHAFATAAQLLSSGDSLAEFILQNGAVFSKATATLPLASPTVIRSFMGLYFLGNASGAFALLPGGVDPASAAPNLWITGVLATGTPGAITGAVYSEATLSWVVGTDTGRLFSVTPPSGATTAVVAEISLSGKWVAGTAIRAIEKVSTETLGLWLTTIMVVGDGGQVVYFDNVSPLVLTTWIPDLPPGAPGGFTWSSVNFSSVVHANGLWVIAGNSATSRSIILTTDLSTPTTFGSVTGELATTTRSVSALAVDGTTLLAVGSTSDTSKQLLVSTDSGLTWVGSIIDASSPALAVRGLVKSLGSWYFYGDAGALYAQSVLGGPAVPTSLPGASNLLSATTYLGLITVIDSTGSVFFTGVSAAGGKELIGSDTYVASTSVGQIKLSAPILLASRFLPGETSKVILLSFQTLRPIDKEFAGIPLDKLTLFTDPVTGRFPIAASIATNNKAAANRVYYPRTNLSLTNPASPFYIHQNGYPLYAEDPSLYIADATGEPQVAKNSALQIITLCDGLGNYIDPTAVELSVSQFILVYTSGVITDIADPRVPAYTPLYDTYADWLASGADFSEQAVNVVAATSGQIADVQILEIHNLETDNPPYIIFDRGLTPSPSIDETAVRITILPQNPIAVPLVGVPHYVVSQATDNLGLTATVSGTQVYYQIPQYEGSLVPATIPSTGTNGGLASTGTQYSLAPQQQVDTSLITDGSGQVVIAFDVSTSRWFVVINANATGVYFPPNGLGGYVGKPATDTRLPWEVDSAAFMYEAAGVPIYLRNLQGDWVVLTNADGTFATGHPLAVAPNHLLFQDLLIDEGSIIGDTDLGLTSGLTVTGVTATAATTSISLSSRLDALKHLVVGDSVQISLLSAASVTLASSNFSNPKLWAELTTADLQVFTPDRVSYQSSNFPVNNSALFTTGTFTNKNKFPVYLCDDQGSLIYASGALVGLVSEAYSPAQPVYLFSKDWFATEFYDPLDLNSNPFWQYLEIKDVLENQQWVQRARILQKKKSAFSRTHVYSEVPAAQAYVSVFPGLEMSAIPGKISFPAVSAFDAYQGVINTILTPNQSIASSASTLYGLAFTLTLPPNYNPATPLDGANPLHTSILANYSINTQRNYLDPNDQTSATVAISEVGIFNKEDNLLAYAIFPPIIYNTTRHHLSLNLFIKEGMFTLTTN